MNSPYHLRRVVPHIRFGMRGIKRAKVGTVSTITPRRGPIWKPKWQSRVFFALAVLISAMLALALVACPDPSAASSHRPDLTVVKASDNVSSVVVDATFDIKVMITNQGAASAVPTTLQWYYSSDSIITAVDSQMGDAFEMAALESGATSEATHTFRAPTRPGTFYYGACVAAVAGETNAQNNCSEAIAIVVTAGPAPDLNFNTMAVSPSIIAPGGNVTLSATVANGGSALAAATSLIWYRSTDNVIDITDVSVDISSVASLAAGAAITLTYSVAVSSIGTLYYGACVDPIANEATANNNCSTAAKVQVKPTFSYVCPYGVAAAGSSFNEGVHKCSSCNLGFSLNQQAHCVANTNNECTSAIETTTSSLESLQVLGLFNGFRITWDDPDNSAIDGVKICWEAHDDANQVVIRDTLSATNYSVSGGSGHYYLSHLPATENYTMYVLLTANTVPRYYAAQRADFNRCSPDSGFIPIRYMGNTPLDGSSDFSRLTRIEQQGCFQKAYLDEQIPTPLPRTTQDHIDALPDGLAYDKDQYYLILAEEFTNTTATDGTYDLATVMDPTYWNVYTGEANKYHNSDFSVFANQPWAQPMHVIDGALRVRKGRILRNVFYYNLSACQTAIAQNGSYTFTNRYGSWTTTTCQCNDVTTDGCTRVWAAYHSYGKFRFRYGYVELLISETLPPTATESAISSYFDLKRSVQPRGSSDWLSNEYSITTLPPYMQPQSLTEELKIMGPEMQLFENVVGPGSGFAWYVFHYGWASNFYLANSRRFFWTIGNTNNNNPRTSYKVGMEWTPRGYRVWINDSRRTKPRSVCETNQVYRCGISHSTHILNHNFYLRNFTILNDNVDSAIDYIRVYKPRDNYSGMTPIYGDAY